MSAKIATGPAFVGLPIGFFLFPVNRGPAAIDANSGVTVSDVLPPKLSLVSFDGGNDWNCSKGIIRNSVLCRYVGQPINAGWVMPSITIDAAGVSPGDFKNCANIKVANDPNPLNDWACAPGSVQESVPIDVTVSKTGTESLNVGDTANFTISVFNHGPSILFAGSELTIIDTLDAGPLPLHFQQMSVVQAPGWNCAKSTDAIIICHYFGTTTGPGQGIDAIQISALALVPGPFKNCAKIVMKMGILDTNPADNESCLNGMVQGSSADEGLRITKMIADNCRTAANPDDDDCIFKVTVTNSGPTPYSGPIVISDMVTPMTAAGPGAFLENASGIPNAPSCDGSAPVTCRMLVPSLKSGESAEFTLQFKVFPSNPDENCATLISYTQSGSPLGQACVKIGG